MMFLDVDQKLLFEYDSKVIERLLPEDNDPIWLEETFRQEYYGHSKTQSIIYVWSENVNNYNYDNIDIRTNRNDKLSEEVWIAAKKIRDYYGPNYKITKLMLVKLLGNSIIEEHIDQGILQNVHRCHLPIRTNDQCKFIINNSHYNLKENCVYELNNAVNHSVVNESKQNRIHLMVDIFNESKT
jgi:hypothetical protein